VIPLIKNEADPFVSDNYRGITLSPVISKLFEMVLLSLFEQHLLSDPLQFDFKKNSSCNHALFTVNKVTDHHIKHGSTVTICALDISKAFDKVNHFAPLQLLMDRKLPKCFIGVLLQWFSKSMACVRWNGQYSFWFNLSAGVRQGGLLFPVLFAVYMDPLI